MKSVPVPAITLNGLKQLRFWGQRSNASIPGAVLFLPKGATNRTAKGGPGLALPLSMMQGLAAHTGLFNKYLRFERPSRIGAIAPKRHGNLQRRVRMIEGSSAARGGPGPGRHALTALGHKERFPTRRLNGRCRFRLYVRGPWSAVRPDVQ